MSYVILFRSSAEKQLEELPKIYYQRIKNKILNLADNPYPAGREKLKGGDKEYRIRVGDYRIIYRVEHAQLIVVIIKIGHRREVYDR